MLVYFQETIHLKIDNSSFNQNRMENGGLNILFLNLHFFKKLSLI